MKLLRHNHEFVKAKQKLLIKINPKLLEQEQTVHRSEVIDRKGERRTDNCNQCSKKYINNLTDIHTDRSSSKKEKRKKVCSMSQKNNYLIHKIYF